MKKGGGAHGFDLLLLDEKVVLLNLKSPFQKLLFLFGKKKRSCYSYCDPKFSLTLKKLLFLLQSTLIQGSITVHLLNYFENHCCIGLFIYLFFYSHFCVQLLRIFRKQKLKKPQLNS